jgi:excisionase family DNA binding protein
VTLRCLPVTEVADRLAVSPDAIYDLIKKGDLPAVKVGARRVVAEDALTRFITEGGRG